MHRRTLHVILAATLLTLAIVALYLRLSSGGPTPQADSVATQEPPSRTGLGAPQAGSPTPPAQAQPQPQTEISTARTLESVDAPGRDLELLTQQLRLHSSVQIPKIVNPTPPDYKVGTRQQFNIADVVKRGYYTATATIKVVTAHAYWYIKDGYNVNQQALEASARYFEDHIYPTDRRVFGSEATPGIDNDPHITILLMPPGALGGFFSSADAYPKVVNPFSNERDIIYIASAPEAAPDNPNNFFEATLAHEFQHMIHWNVQPDKEVWMDEGCSEIAQFVNGYSAGGTDMAFVMNPDTQLNAWDQPTQNAAHYGASYMFLRYLMDRYGGESFISSLMQQHILGTGAIDATVKQKGNPAGFEGAFQDWIIANTLNDSTIANGRYSYAEGGRAAVSRTLDSYPATFSAPVHQYAANYISLAGSLGAGTVTFQGSPSVRVIAADPHSGSSFWYSNRRDSGDATLTRELDLTAVKSATLRFWTWYDIERLFDYAYIETSTDGGKTWTPLPGKYTTTENSNGTGYGPGWTGKSGVAAGATDPASWVEESVDLSAYAGTKVLARFQYITDEGLNLPGMAIDDISIPETGYSDDAEADNGWLAKGFVRIGSLMPERWFVALIEKGKTNTVREMTIDANGAGTLDLAGIGSGAATREATLVIAPMSPKTTETGVYTVTVKGK